MNTQTENPTINGVISLADLIAGVITGYEAAAIFTDCGEDDQPPTHAIWSQDATDTAENDCEQFVRDNVHLIAAALRNGKEAMPEYSACHIAEYIGHDFWLTRNHHGSGFWDRPERWGEREAQLLTDAANKSGECYLYAGDDGLIYLQ